MEVITLWPGGPALPGGPGVQKPGTDAVLLAGFASRARHVADLGCGGGVIALLLAAAWPDSSFVGIELDPAACGLAREAAAANGWQERMRVLEADLRCLDDLPKSGSFDLAVSNPPYFALDTGARAAGDRPRQRSEETCTILEVCRAASRLVRWGGRFCLVYRPERLTDLITALRQCALEPKRLQLVRRRPESAASLVLVEARRGGKPGLTITNDFYLQTADGGESPQLAALYHKEVQA